MWRLDHPAESSSLGKHWQDLERAMPRFLENGYLQGSEPDQTLPRCPGLGASARPAYVYVPDLAVVCRGHLPRPLPEGVPASRPIHELISGAGVDTTDMAPVPRVEDPKPVVGLSTQGLLNWMSGAFALVLLAAIFPWKDTERVQSRAIGVARVTFALPAVLGLILVLANVPVGCVACQVEGVGLLLGLCAGVATLLIAGVRYLG
jgi:hypothetical protein